MLRAMGWIAIVVCVMLTTGPNSNAEQREECDDGHMCTIDVWNPITEECENTPSDPLCDDGIYCNGDEHCTPSGACHADQEDPCDVGEYCMEDAGEFYGCADCILDFDNDGDLTIFDFYIFDACMDVQYPHYMCNDDANGLQRMPLDEDDYCCTVNSHPDTEFPPWIETIDMDDFYGFAACAGFDIGDCDNCDGPFGDPPVWDEEFGNECVEYEGDGWYCEGALPECQGDYSDGFRTCVECTLNDHCDAPTPACATWLAVGWGAPWECVECLTTSNCTDEVCQVNTEDEFQYTCVECVTHNDCSLPLACCGGSSRDWTCQGCGS